MSKLIFKNIIAFIIFFTLTSVRVNSQDRVGINNDNPQAALDIKSDSQDDVLRVSVPNDVEQSKIDDGSFVLFAGVPKENDEETSYLRTVTINRLIKQLVSYVPAFNTITATNRADNNFNKPDGEDQKVIINQVLENTNEDMFEYVPSNNSVKIKQAGYYNVDAFIGFKRLPNYYEGDILVSVAKKETNGNFVNFKRGIVTRTSGQTNYDVGTGVGSSISFYHKFEENDEINLNVMKYTGGKDLVILENGAILTVKRVTPINILN